MVLLDGTPAPGRSVSELEQALRAHVDRLKAEPVKPEELDRIKTRVVASDVYQRDSLFYQAMRLGSLETTGVGWRRTEDYVPRIKAVTPAQVQQVAQKYLTDNALTVAILEPTPPEGELQAMNGGDDVR